MKRYENPKADITILQCEDVMTASGETQVMWNSEWLDGWSWWDKN